MPENYPSMIEAVVSPALCFVEASDYDEQSAPEGPDPVETGGELLNPEPGQQKLSGVKFAYDVLDSDPDLSES